MRFFTTYGIEFTYLLQDIYYRSGDEDDMCEATSDIMEEELRRWGRKRNRNSRHNDNFNFLDVHNDCCAIEIGSPIFKKISDVRVFYKKMDDIAKELNLTTHRETTGGGGGHIHAGIPKKILNNEELISRFVVNIHRDMANRPYLNSLFNEYVDDHTSNHPCNSVRNFLNTNIKTDKDIDSVFDRDYHNYDYSRHVLNRGSTDEGYVNIQSEYNTVEFRIFDMPKSLARLEKHLEFVDAYMRYIVGLTKSGIIVPVKCRKNTTGSWYKYRESFKDIDKTKREFKEFLRTLGLQYRPYAYLLQENFIKRLEAGYKIN